MGEKTINQLMKEYGIDTSWYDIKSDNSTPITAAKSTLANISGHYNDQQGNQIIGLKEKTKQEKAYEN